MFNTRIKELRKQRELTQKELASAIGVTSGCLSHWEQGTRFPEFESIKALSIFFDVSIDYLTGITDEKQDAQAESILALMQDMTKEELEELNRYKNYLLSLRETKQQPN